MHRLWLYIFMIITVDCTRKIAVTVSKQLLIIDVVHIVKANALEHRQALLLKLLLLFLDGVVGREQFGELGHVTAHLLHAHVGVRVLHVHAMHALLCARDALIALVALANSLVDSHELLLRGQDLVHLERLPQVLGHEFDLLLNETVKQVHVVL
jgi:hypothetical protein